VPEKHFSASRRPIQAALVRSGENISYTIDGRAALAGVASGGVRWLLFAPYFYSKLLTCLLINTLD